MKHGTANAYVNFKCRCGLCRSNRGERSKQYREADREKFAAQRRAEYAANPDRFKDLTKARYRKTANIVNRYKLMVGCQVCGYRKCSRSLQFHHRNPAEKDFTISINLTKGWQVVKQEIRKCEVLCANCHGERHEEWDAA